jgi:RNA polymerase sigma-70 factor (ECF subfamily)
MKGTAESVPSASQLASAAAGDPTAQEEVLRSCYEPVRRRLFHLLGPGHDLDDLHQVVLLKVLEGLPRYQAGAPFLAWVMRICVNAATDSWRRTKVRSLVSPTEQVDQLYGETDPPTDPAIRVDRRRQLAQAQQAIEQLTPKQRTAFVLKHLYGHSVSEIAELTEHSVSAVRMHLYSGRRAFARAVSALDGEKSARAEGSRDAMP